MCLSIKRDGERKDEIPDIQVNTLAVYISFSRLRTWLCHHSNYKMVPLTFIAEWKLPKEIQVIRKGAMLY